LAQRAALGQLSGMLARLTASGLLLSAILLASNADARVEARSGYTKAQTFNGALRFLRVDKGYDVVEKDPDAAYVLFRYPLQGKATANGSVEVVETSSGIKLVVQLPQLPEYHEVVLRDALLKKLRDEYGSPPPKAKEKSKDTPTGGAAGTGGSDSGS
jgi:hypothetical protein